MDLAELIAIRKGDRTYRELERDCGGELGAARWQQLATRVPRGFPDVSSMVAIADALDVPEETVLLAAGASLGLQPRRRSRLVDLIPDRAADLPDRAINAVIALITAMISIQDGAPL